MENSLMPDLPLDAHSVPLGLLFHSGKNINTEYKNGAFVVRRGGVSTSKLTGYDVLFIPFKNGKPIQSYRDLFVWLYSQRGKREHMEVSLLVLQKH